MVVAFVELFCCLLCEFFLLVLFVLIFCSCEVFCPWWIFLMRFVSVVSSIFLSMQHVAGVVRDEAKHVSDGKLNKQ